MVTEAVAKAVSSQRYSPGPRRSMLHPHIVTAPAKMVPMSGLFKTPFLILTTLVWTNCPLLLCLCLRFWAAGGGGEKKLQVCRHANGRAVVHRSVISGEICLSWKKSSLMCSHHLLNLDHCQTPSKNRFPDSLHEFTLKNITSTAALVGIANIWVL